MKRSPLAASLAASLHARDIAEDDGGLIAYAERLSKRTETSPVPMRHLAPVAQLLERAAAGECVRAVIAAPVRHGKTTLVKASILYLLRRNPRLRINFASYASDLAEAKMYEVRQLAPSQGIRMAPDFDTDAEWRTIEGGAVKAGGLIGGPWNGQGANVGFVDDPYKNAEQADSFAYREKTSTAFWSAFMTRLEPGASCFEIAACWGNHDLGQELRRKGWEWVCLPALDESEQPLWPERWSRDELLRVRASQPARLWAALYQGSPLPEGGRIFDPSHLAMYDALPSGPYIDALGLDLAYGARRQHDRSALVVFRRYTARPRELYLVECHSGHAPIELYSARVAEVQLRRAGLATKLTPPREPERVVSEWLPQIAAVGPYAPRIAARWYTSTTEAGTASLMAGYGAHVDAVRAAVDKLARAQAGGYAAAWAEGRIAIPRARLIEGGHLERWIRAHQDFTGQDGCEDDEVDAAVAAHDLLALPALGLGESHAVGAGGDDWQQPSAILPGGEASTGYALGSGTPTVSEWD